MHEEEPTYLDFLVNLRDTFLRVDIEDERPQGLNVAVVDWTPAVLEVGGEQLQDPGQSGFYKAAFALVMGEEQHRPINFKFFHNSWKVSIKGFIRKPNSPNSASLWMCRLWSTHLSIDYPSEEEVTKARLQTRRQSLCWEILVLLHHLPDAWSSAGAPWWWSVCMDQGPQS